MNWSGNENFQRALTALQAGNLKEAERFLVAVTRAQPKHVPALNLLGVVFGGWAATPRRSPVTIGL